MTNGLRVTTHPVLDVSMDGRKKVSITVDGSSLEVMEGEVLAAALWANGFISLGLNPSDGDASSALRSHAGNRRPGFSLAGPPGGRRPAPVL